MAVTAEKPGSFPRGHSLHLGSHPQEAGSGSFIGDGVQKEQEQKLQGLCRLKLTSAQHHPAAFHWSEQAAVAEGLRLTGRAAKNLLSPTTQFQHVHHPEANTVQHAVCSAYVKRTHRKFIKQEI